MFLCFPAWLDLSLADRKALILPPSFVVESLLLSHYALSHSHINTFPSFQVPSLHYLLFSPSHAPRAPHQKKTLIVCSFEAESGLRCSYQVRETRALHPQGDCAELVIQMRKHSTHLKSSFYCFSCFTTFFLTTATWRNMIALRCSRLPRPPPPLPPPLRLKKLSQARWSPGKMWLLGTKKCGGENLNTPCYRTSELLLHVCGK